MDGVHDGGSLFLPITPHNLVIVSNNGVELLEIRKTLLDSSVSQSGEPTDRPRVCAFELE